MAKNRRWTHNFDIFFCFTFESIYSFSKAYSVLLRSFFSILFSLNRWFYSLRLVVIFWHLERLCVSVVLNVVHLINRRNAMTPLRVNMLFTKFRIFCISFHIYSLYYFFHLFFFFLNAKNTGHFFLVPASFYLYTICWMWMRVKKKTILFLVLSHTLNRKHIFVIKIFNDSDKWWQ